MSSRRSGQRVRFYSYVFVAGLCGIALALVVAAVTASDEHRGGYTGMAVLWGSGALAAAALLMAIERRRPGD
jgi:hypothetical protein